MMFHPDPLFSFSAIGLSITLLILVSAIIFVESRLRSVAILFWLATLVIYVAPSFGDPWIYDARTHVNAPPFSLVNNRSLLEAHIFSITFSALYLIARLAAFRAEQPLSVGVTPEELPDILRREPHIDSLIWIVVGLVIGSLGLGYLAIAIPQGWDGFLRGTYSSYRLESIPQLKLASYYLLHMTSFIVFVTWATKKWALMAVVIAALIGVFLLGRTRQLILPMAIPFALYAFYRFQTPRGIVALVFLGAVFYYFLVMAMLVRDQGSLVDGLTALVHPEIYQTFFNRVVEGGGGEAVFRFPYYYIVDSERWFPSEHFGQTYKRLLMTAVPTSLAGGLKPVELNEALYAAYYPLHENVGYRGTLHILLFGNSYANFGWLGVFLGLFWGGAAHLVNKILYHVRPTQRVALYCPVGFALIMMARGSVTISFSVVIVSALGIAAIFAIHRRLFARGDKKPVVTNG